MTELSAIVKEMSDKEASEAALISNLQREDLNPVEEVVAIALHAARLAGSEGLEEGIKELRIAHNFKRKKMNNAYYKNIDDMVVRVTGSDVVNFCKSKLRLLLMEPFLQEAVVTWEIDPTKATLIARLDNVETQQTVLAEAVDKGLSWQEVKDLVAAARKEERGEKPVLPKKYVHNAFLPTTVKLKNLSAFLETAELDDDVESEITALFDQAFAILERNGALGRVTASVLTAPLTKGERWTRSQSTWRVLKIRGVECYTCRLPANS